MPSICGKHERVSAKLISDCVVQWFTAHCTQSHIASRCACIFIEQSRAAAAATTTTVEKPTHECENLLDLLEHEHRRCACVYITIEAVGHIMQSAL